MAVKRTGGDKWMKFCNSFWAQYRRAGITVIPCALCGEPVDTTKRGRDPDSRSVDHIIPVSQGGRELDLKNVAAVHWACNRQRQDRPMAEFATPQQKAVFAKVVRLSTEAYRARQEHRNLLVATDEPRRPWAPLGWYPDQRQVQGEWRHSCCGDPIGGDQWWDSCRKCF